MKDKRIKIRVDGSELASIQAKARAAGLTVSALIRQSLDRATIHNKAETRKLVREVNRIGVNLNQLARWANTYPTPAVAGDIFEQLLRISEQIDAIRREGGG